MSKNELQIEWEERLKGFESSKQNLTSWCREKGLSVHQAKYWRRKLQSSDQLGRQSTQWLAVELNGSEKTDVHHRSTALSIKVGLAMIEIQPGYNDELLKDVVRTLSTLC